jgi:hypothetical protein
LVERAYSSSIGWGGNGTARVAPVSLQPCFFVKRTRAIVVGERPEPGLLYRCPSQAIECEVVEETADPSPPDAGHHIESPEITVANDHGCDGLAGIDGEIYLHLGVG